MVYRSNRGAIRFKFDLDLTLEWDEITDANDVAELSKRLKAGRFRS